MPGGRDTCPVEVRVDDFGREEPYPEVQRPHNDNERAINSYSTIYPIKGDRFGLYLALCDGFDWKGYSHVKVSLFVDGWFVRTQYLESKYDEWKLGIKKGRKLDEARSGTVEFSLLVGDVGNPGLHELDGTISVELSLGHKIFRRSRIPKANLVEETETFKHGISEPVPSPKPTKQMFISAPRGHFTPMRWYFMYAEKVYRSDRTGPATVSLNGLGKRPQECEDVYGEAQNQNYKRTRMGGGLAAEYLGDAAEPPRGQEGHAMRRREPIELFPERNGDLYVEVPAYGTFR